MILIQQLIEANTFEDPITAAHGDEVTVRCSDTGHVCRLKLIEWGEIRRAWIDLDTWEMRTFSSSDNPAAFVGGSLDMVLSYPAQWPKQVKVARKKGRW